VKPPAPMSRQVEAVRLVLARQMRLAAGGGASALNIGRQAEEALIADDLTDALKTMEWLAANANDLRAALRAWRDRDGAREIGEQAA
jgi:hypothetical protein